MSIDTDYVRNIETRLEFLEEENKSLRNLVDNGVIRFRDFPTFQKKSIFHPFRKTLRDKLEFGYCYMNWSGYTKVKNWIRTSPQGVVNKIKGLEVGNERNIYPTIKSKFNGLHYAMFDCDNSSDIKKASGFFESLCVSYFIIESSNMHYWVVGDIGNLDYNNIFRFIRDVNFSDKQFLNCSLEQGYSIMRAYKRRGEEYPIVYNITSKEKTTQNFKLFHSELEKYFKSDYPVYFGKHKNIGMNIV